MICFLDMVFREREFWFSGHSVVIGAIETDNSLDSLYRCSYLSRDDIRIYIVIIQTQTVP
jgi:hypothetical protein